jgi:hypothetical protein
MSQKLFPARTVLPDEIDSSGLTGVAQAFGRAIQSQFHPRMLFALLLPFLIMLGGAVLMLLIALGPLTSWLDQQISESTTIIQANQWMLSMGLFSLMTVQSFIVPLTAVAFLLPLSGILGLAVAAVCVMPIVISHLSARDYKGLKMQGQQAFVVSLWNAIWVSMLFALGWLLTLPFWLIPPLGLLVSIFWWTFAFSRMMRLDAIVEHASAEERRVLITRHNLAFWTIGLICALINLIPPAWVFLPVFSGLVYTHFGLEALRRLRNEKTLDN